MDSKICNNCKKELTIDNFHKQRAGKFGVKSKCKECCNKRNNPPNEDINIKQTCTGICVRELPATTEFFYKKKNGKFGVRGKCKECYNKRQKEKNNPPNEDSNIKKTCTDCNKEFPATLEFFHKNKSCKFGVAAECKECSNKKLKQWQKDNKDKRREYGKEYKKNKYQNDQQFRIRQLLSTGLRQALNKMGQSKNASILDYIGCDIAFLEKHLNSTKGDNWGDVELHIDHIIPQSLYDHTNKEEIKKCWNWRNLRYFPGADNSSKGNILDIALVKQYGIDDLLPDF